MPGVAISPVGVLLSFRQVWEFLKGQPINTTFVVTDIQETPPAIAPFVEKITGSPLRLWYVTIWDKKSPNAYMFILIWGAKPCNPGDQFEVGNIGLLLKRLQ